ncbi:MAG: hypothetical protein IJZ75_07160 [Clostridia bacterium]|nr:hypothetical protein [Clostridia bacterium]
MENVKSASKIFLRIVAVTLLCFFSCIAFLVICNGIGTEKIGYTVYGATEGDEELTELYTHYYSDGVDERQAEFEEKGYAMQKVTIHSRLSGGMKAIFLILTQVSNLVILVAFIYHHLWDLGAKDLNLVKFGHKAEDKLRGFKIGLLASIPNILFFCTLVVFKNSFMAGFNAPFYKFIVSYFYSFVELILNGVTDINALSLWQFAALGALLLVIPVITEVAYLLGYKGVIVSDKLIYKKGEE